MCHNNIGCLYFKRGDFLKAEEHFTKAIKVSIDREKKMEVMGLGEFFTEEFSEEVDWMH